MNIEVFHDLICPWCRIGNQNLIDALEKWDGDTPTVQYRTFLLNPGTPEDGITFEDYMKAKGAENTKYEDFIKPITVAGNKVGVSFNFDNLEKITNTIIGHRFLHLIPENSKSKALDLLHLAYFEEGQDISNIDNLLGIAKNLDLNIETLKQELHGEGGKQETLMDFYYAIQIGISSVPMFIFDNKTVLSGAQSPEKILETMKKAKLLPDPPQSDEDGEIEV